MAGRKSRNSISVKMCPQQRARHEAYSEPSKETQRWMAEARQRVCTHLNHQKSRQVCDPTAAAERQNQLTAQLKAAEARNRVRQLRLHYQDLKARCLFVWLVGRFPQYISFYVALAHSS